MGRIVIGCLLALFYTSPCWAWMNFQHFAVGVEDGAATCSGNYGRTSGTSENVITPFQHILLKITTDCAFTSGTINVMLYLANTSNSEVTFAIYTDNAGEPAARVWQSSAPLYDVDTASEFAAVSDNFTYSGTAGTYWVGVAGEAPSTTHIQYELATGQVRHIITTDLTWPDNWNTAGDTASTAERAIWLGF